MVKFVKLIKTCFWCLFLSFRQSKIGRSFNLSSRSIVKRVVTVTQLIICDSAFSVRRRIPNQYLTVKRFNVQFEQKINEKASENKK